MFVLTENVSDYTDTEMNVKKYPHFDEAVYLKKAKIRDSGHFETFRSSLPETAFGPITSIPILGLMVCLFTLAFIPWIAIASHMIQISYRRDLAYKIYLEECESIKSNKKGEYFDTTKFNYYSSKYKGR